MNEVESELGAIVDAGDVLGPLTLKKRWSLTKITLEGPAYYSRFRLGDRIEIRQKKLNNDKTKSLSTGWKVEAISHPEPGRIEVNLSGGKPVEDAELFEVFLFKESSTLFNNILLKRLRKIESDKSTIVLGKGRFTLNCDNLTYRQQYENLNKVQQEALEYLIENNLSGAIQGPPGTGKTHLLNALISLALKSNMKVGVTSFTNAAVDNLLGRVVDAQFDSSWVRVGDGDRVRRDFYRKVTQDFSFAASSFSPEVGNHSLIGATLHKMAFNQSTPVFDLLVVDEAGQVPLYFWPFIQRMARRVVLVGDQYQLPPVLTCKHLELPADNVFSFCIDKETPMLETQYRMRDEIQGWSSEKFYKGLLSPHESVHSRDYFAASPAFFTDGYITAKSFENGPIGKTSFEEADYIADKVARLLRSGECLSHIGVICPYRAQAGIVNATLQNKFGVELASEVLVDTVERFQGQEKEAIFLSFGSSGHLQGDIDFLSDPKRLNVSITRAKSRFFCLFNKNLLHRSSGRSSESLHEFLEWNSGRRPKIKKAA